MNENHLPSNNCSSSRPLDSGHSPSEFSSRLTPLCDGRPGLRTTLQIQVQPDASERSSTDGSSLPVIDFVSSDATLDRYDEIISPAGWRLDNYRRNPVFQNAHQYGDIIFTLGKALITEVRMVPFPHLYQRIEFAVDVNPMARIAYGLYKNKFLNAVSVGFIPIRWQNGDATEHNSREFSRMGNYKPETASSPSPPKEKGERPPSAGRSTASARQQASPSNGSERRQARRIYLEQELLEVSAVGIPANPEALQLGLKAGAIEKSDLKTLLELLLENEEGRKAQSSSDSIIHHPLKHHPPSIIPKNPLCPTYSHSPFYSSPLALLQLARALRELLRRH